MEKQQLQDQGGGGSTQQPLKPMNPGHQIAQPSGLGQVYTKEPGASCMGSSAPVGGGHFVPTKFQTNISAALAIGDMKVIGKNLNEGNINSPINQFGDTPLHFAIFHNNRDLIKKLLSLKADAYIQNQRGVSPIELAESYQLFEVVQILRKSNL